MFSYLITFWRVPNHCKIDASTEVCSFIFQWWLSFVIFNISMRLFRPINGSILSLQEISFLLFFLFNHIIHRILYFLESVHFILELEWYCLNLVSLLFLIFLIFLAWFVFTYIIQFFNFIFNLFSCYNKIFSPFVFKMILDII